MLVIQKFKHVEVTTENTKIIKCGEFRKFVKKCQKSYSEQKVFIQIKVHTNRYLPVFKLILLYYYFIIFMVPKKTANTLDPFFAIIVSFVIATTK